MKHPAMEWKYSVEYDILIKHKQNVQKRKKKDLMIFMENKVTCV